VLGGRSEVTAIWSEDAMPAPVTCRARLDHLDGRTIYDLKIVESAHPDAIRRHMMTFGSAIQATAYTRAVEHLRPELAGRVRFVFLFCEVETGIVTPAILGGSMRELGARQWDRAVATWARCTATNTWPSYTDRPVVVEAPSWAIDAEENVLLDERAAQSAQEEIDDE
jgi:hypothetical protein